MNYKEYELPDDLLYNEDSSWVKIEGDTATVGIIEPVAKVLKEFLFVKLPDKQEIKAGEVYVSLETLKWSGHLKSPLSGEIVAVNETLYDEPNRINEKPYDSWIIKIKLKDEDEVNKLHKPEQITGWLEKTIK